MEVNMKKCLAFLAAAALVFGLAACGENRKEVTIDYGKSDIYSRSDMDAAIELIENKFATWEEIGRAHV